MPRILAIEADPKRRGVLTALVREHVKADLVVVASVGAAVASIDEHIPDLIVAPTLLPPGDEAELRARVKQLTNAPYVQMVTLPALDMLVDAPREESGRRGLFGPVFSRRPVSLGLQYDRNMVAAQIADGLERARVQRLEYAAMLAYSEAAAERAAFSTKLVRSVDLDASDDFISRQLREAASREAANDERRVALRKQRGDVPWLSGIKLSWGPELKLVNISSTGVLVETGSKLAPGSTQELHLSGPETNLVVPVRFIRSDVARIDGLGVRYHAAAAFSKEIDLSGLRRRASVSAPPSLDLAGLLSDVLATPRDNREPAHQQFATGLRRLVGARDVQVRTGAMGVAGGPETLYFDVPGDDRARRTLQVIFDRGHDVTDEEFRLLRAAAWMTAAVIELEKPATATVEQRLLAEYVA
jgi:CheY-like chemotaxis protein